ncbi:hypothetical protein RAS1_42610 [Phycisphaerae bacterium RAS1]|nr:hypothetical protein RAS1_42610 [Phycisphaerae bacterium RAS1]
MLQPTAHRCRRSSVISVSTLVVGLSAWIVYTLRPLPNVANITTERQLIGAVDRAVADVAWSRSLQARETAERYLEAIVFRLMSGWPELRASDYHPAGFSEMDVLGHVYAKLAWYAESNARNKDALAKVLYAIAPAEDDLVYGSWRRAVVSCGLPLPTSARP